MHLKSNPEISRIFPALPDMVDLIAMLPNTMLASVTAVSIFHDNSSSLDRLISLEYLREYFHEHIICLSWHMLP